MKRRDLLASAAAGAALALAGCTDGGDGGGTTTDPTGGAGGGTTTATDPAGGGTGLPDHAALEGIDSQPHLGPAPGEARATIVAFEDPSCPRCAAFERNTVPQIESELTSTGTATYVFRGYPVVYPWGDPATRALEAVYAEDTAAFWTLASHYFEAQGDFSAAGKDAVYDRTETFLAENTGLDATGVVDAARNGDADAAVQTDLDAGKAAGAGRTTPHVFMFADGEFKTKAAGSASFNLIKSALGV